MSKRNPTVVAAMIGAAAVIVAAIVGAILQPSWWRSESSATATTLTIAGTVVEESTNRAIGQARISIVGRAEASVTEDNGNFRIRLQSDIPKDGLVRLHVVKDGYLPSDETTTQTDTLIVQLRKK
jgi:hypothetical protein